MYKYVKKIIYKQDLKIFCNRIYPDIKFLCSPQISGSGITGYAANNSRALERRRSSVSEYVLSQDEEEVGERVRLGRQPSKKKVRRHVLTQESYETSERVRAGTRRAASLDQYLDMDCTH